MYQKYADLRDEKGITDYRVAKDTGVSTSTLTHWKRGLYEPKYEKKQLLAQYFGKPNDYFME